ncbi:MAG: hypothetical protein RIC35_14415 [Marinoscillum sp.]
MIRTSLKCSVFLFLLICLFGSVSVHAQTTTEEPDEYIAEVNSLVSFYKYMLNTVGAPQTSTRDKEVIITESFKKAFKDKFVQVEDDLMPDRNAITNKDITAYLRDVDFFFQNITFNFSEIEISRSERDNGKPFYLVAFQNEITATTLEGEAFKKNSKRYIEANLDEENGDLKIVSVYTTKISREKELRNWWETLSYEWTRILSENVPAYDSITKEVLFKMADLDSLNLSGNQFIQNIKPLSALTKLKVLDISNTKVESLNPLRYSLRLEKLIAKNSKISEVSVFEYFENLKTLDLSHSPVVNIAPIGKLKNLNYLNLAATDIVIFDGLKDLGTLKEIDISNTALSNSEFLSANKNLEKAILNRTGITSLKAFSGMNKLKELDVSETYISDLNALSGHPSLEVLLINQTRVDNLSPLMNVSSLKKIYADYTGISEARASEFMSKNRKVIVITNSERVMDWWSGLSSDWKGAFGNYVPTNPSKEDIVKLLNIDSLDVSNKNLVSAEPLSRLKRLRYLNVSKNMITSFAFTADMENLEFLKAEKMPAETAIGLEKNKNLRYVILIGSIIKDIQSLQELNKLELVDVNGTEVREKQVKDFLKVSPSTVVIYQPDFLADWWSQLPDEWQKVFNLAKVDSYHLHKLVESEKLVIENAPISSLRPLDAFINLKSITLDRTRVSSLIDLSRHEHIEEIICRNGPLMNLESVGEHYDLRKLDISNTAVEDLKPLRDNRNLEALNCSGTNIKKLKGLEDLNSLQKLDISNTRVWRVDRLYDIRNLNTLVCYNTRIRSHTMEDFQSDFPDCDVTYY